MMLFVQVVSGQSVLNPADPVVTYNAATPPTQPAFGTIGKWVRTVKVSWNSTGYKAYIYKNNPFRLYFPKTYNPTATDGKKYPMMIFFHGAGEGANTLYDNEYSLYHGGQFFGQSVDNGKFDGYILVMQTSGGWGPTQYGPIKELIDYMITNNKLDPFKVSTNGLSGGGGATWNMYLTYPTYVSTLIPMSAVSIEYTADATTNLVKYTPIWNIHGGLDGSPAPYTAMQVNNAMLAKGANYIDLNMTTQGHDTWDSTWSMPGFWPFINKGYSSNPWTLFGRTQFCPGDPINVTVGVITGFSAYQWRKNGVVIAGATSNTIQVTSIGTYDCRVQRAGGIWSDWSPIPVVIALKTPTVTPPITVSGLMSKVIPAPDGNTGVNLMVPAGYASYLWQKQPSTTTIGTSNIQAATTPGNYIVSVTEQFGCSSNFSPAFTVINANGPNKPDPASGLSVTTLSPTSLLLNWSQNPSPINNETNFEVYQSKSAGGPYKLVDITGADIAKDTLKGLSAGTKYYYIVRAVNNTAASAISAEASGSTVADTQPPTAPPGLTVTATTRSSVSLDWNASTDNVGVTEYDVYVNGAKSYVVDPSQTQFTVSNLQYNQSYAFVIKALDLAGNNSPASNQVTGQAIGNGLTYKFYPMAAQANNLPNLSSMSPSVTGMLPNFSLTPATQSTNYVFLFEGYLHVTTAGTYNFRTTSDDGSKLYLGTLNSNASAYDFASTALVNNDGLHGAATVTSANKTLQVGVYPIAVAFMNGGGGASLTVQWKIPGSGSYVNIPNSAFADAAANNGSAPAAPSNVKAVATSYNKIGLSWTDNSNDETGFEIWRSTSPTTGYITIGNTGAGATSFIDSTVNPSTRYYYQVKSINLYGGSVFASNYAEADFEFNNNYVDSTGNGHTLTLVGAPTFDAVNKAEGGYSVKLSGSNQALTINNTPSSFLQESYAQRTVSLWLKSSSTSGANRIIFDIGGSDNGLALVLNNTTLIAAVASGSNRSSISTTYNNTNWNHIAVVYNGDSLLLYVNGVLATSKTDLSFHSIGTTSNGSRIGQTNGTNAFNTTGNVFGGNIDDFSVFNTAFTAATINSVKDFSFVASNATTQALPAVPAAPTGLAAVATSPSSVKLTWTNNGGNADKYEVYRSTNDNQNYVLWATLAGNAVTYTDADLFANALYYYKVRAVNAGGNSAFSAESSARTLDNPPVITKLPANQQVKYGITTTVALSATHVGGGNLTFSGSNLPAFATLTDNHDGTASLAFSPAVTDQNTYPNLSVTVTDAFGGTDITTFNLVVNNNNAPVINPISNYTLGEGESLNIALNSSDPDAADVLTVEVSGAPAGSVLTPVSNGVATLVLHPGYSASGTYTVQVKSTDNNGLSVVRTFAVTVQDRSPNTSIYAHVAYQDNVPLPWNSLLGTSTSNLLDSAGNTTSVGLNFTPANWWTPFNGGASTGNNSGVYPDHVLQDYMWFGATYGGPDPFTGQVTGLDTTQTYSLTFFASSVYNGFGDNGTTTYTVGSQTVSLAVQNNSKNTVTISNIKPAADGTITFVMNRTSTTPLGYFNAIVITKQFDDGSAPAGASNLTGQVSTGKVQLSWTDSAYNATGYQIWRAPASTGVFAQLGTVSGNTASSYTDSNIVGNTKYLYTVRAYNSHGTSGYSDTLTLTTLNRLPKVNAIADVSLKNNQQTTINVTTVDDPSAVLTLSVKGLPPFAAFTDNGDGTGTISVTPSAGTAGVYPNITVTATDASDSTATTSFTLAVTEPNVSSVYVNFTGGPTSPKPWNTLLTPPFAGTVMSNLVDDGNNVTGISMTMPDGFYWFSASGRFTGNNDGVYPPVVMRSGVYEPTTAARRLQVKGLDVAKTYNFVFFNSQQDGTNGLTNYTINGQTVSLQASFNINKTVQINGIRPDASGAVTISVAKATGAANAYLGAVVIQGYATNAAAVLNPSDLRVLTYTQGTVSLQWQDRSANETGFEVWRGDISGVYAKVATLPAGTVTYKDSRLTANKDYYYIVRAIMGATPSDYSNVAAVTTASDQIYINVNSGSNAAGVAPAPWNNLNSLPAVGVTWNNFRDSTGNPTSVSMVQTQEFAGLNAIGQTTGNNSGIYPDAVLMEDYVAFQGQVGGLQLFGLNLSKKYDLTFLAGDNLFGDNTTAYAINGDTVFLNAMYNTSATVTMHGVTPDNFGRIDIKILPYGQASGGGWINAMVIQGYTKSSSNAPAPPQSTGGANRLAATATGASYNAGQTLAMDSTINAYPNPFQQFFTVQVPAFTNNDKVNVTVYNLAGQQVYAKQFSGLVQGQNFLRVEANSNFGKAGIYIVRVVNQTNNSTQTFKLIKN